MVSIKNSSITNSQSKKSKGKGSANKKGRLTVEGHTASRNFNEDIAADLSYVGAGGSAQSSHVDKDIIESMKAREAVEAAKKRLNENKVSMKDNQKKFSQLMKHSEDKNLKALEHEIKHLNRLNGLNNKLVKEAQSFAKAKQKVTIKAGDAAPDSHQIYF